MLVVLGSRMMHTRKTFPTGQTSAAHRRGSVVVRALLLLALAVVIALAIGVAMVFAACRELQRATDATALSVARMLAQARSAESLDVLLPRVAVAAAEQHFIGRAPFTLDPAADFELGRIVGPSADVGDAFRVGVRPYNAVRIRGRRTDDSPDGALPLPWLTDLGLPALNVVRTSTAAILPWDIAVVMEEPRARGAESAERLRTAGRGLIRTIEPLSKIFGDRGALIVYGKARRVEADLGADLRSLRKLAVGLPATPYEGLADLAAGIRGAREVLTGPRARDAAPRMMILVTAGPPWAQAGEAEPADAADARAGTGAALERLKGRAFKEAQSARRDGISIHVLSVQAGADQEFLDALASMTRGSHFHITTGLDASGGELSSMLLRVTRSRPVALVD